MRRSTHGDGHRVSERGVTTAEALVAGMILSLGLLAATQVMIGASRASAAADDRTVAGRIATSQLGELRSLSYDELAVDLTNTDAVTTFEGLSTVGGGADPIDPLVTAAVDGTTYEVRRHVLWAPIGSDRQAYKRVVVIVSWTDGTSQFDQRVDSGFHPLLAP